MKGQGKEGLCRSKADRTGLARKPLQAGGAYAFSARARLEAAKRSAPGTSPCPATNLGVAAKARYPHR